MGFLYLRSIVVRGRETDLALGKHVFLSDARTMDNVIRGDE